MYVRKVWRNDRAIIRRWHNDCRMCEIICKCVCQQWEVSANVPINISGSMSSLINSRHTWDDFAVERKLIDSSAYHDWRLNILHMKNRSGNENNARLVITILYLACKHQWIILWRVFNCSSNNSMKLRRKILRFFFSYYF